ncbi:unnamed protein product [Polarella glacialis]|uniref:Uncharacterized protein n=1 Tax=Polarella glacialis TaxID=89957 RepID=A0A813KC15_POLGL|nr:unnamed protein product [Polarella glacialis]
MQRAGGTGSAFAKDQLLVLSHPSSDAQNITALIAPAASVATTVLISKAFVPLTIPTLPPLVVVTQMQMSTVVVGEAVVAATVVVAAPVVVATVVVFAATTVVVAPVAVVVAAATVVVGHGGHVVALITWSKAAKRSMLKSTERMIWAISSD